MDAIGNFILKNGNAAAPYLMYAFFMITVTTGRFSRHTCTETKMLLNQKYFFPKACISWIQINML